MLSCWESVAVFLVVATNACKINAAAKVGHVYRCLRLAAVQARHGYAVLSVWRAQTEVARMNKATSKLGRTFVIVAGLE